MEVRTLESQILLLKIKMTWYDPMYALKIIPLTKSPSPLFSPMFHFHTRGKPQKTFGFLTFSGGKVMEHWVEID